MVFTNVSTPRSHVSRKHAFERTRVCRGASIGANATILCGTTLGEYSFVAAGAVVTRNVTPFALVAGVPARQIGWVCQCGARLGLPVPLPPDSSGTCVHCGTGYVARAGGLARVGK
jgi:UDP-2-acetamido-3-amino-2,3-dideoxy-glucuronate N-acetyltransferase